jgi:CRP/FNR family transcriptional regulator, cyclic AMP receptor protein
MRVGQHDIRLLRRQEAGPPFVGMSLVLVTSMLSRVRLRHRQRGARGMIVSEDLIEALARAPLFGGLSMRELSYLAMGAEDIDVPAGHVLVREGESGRQFFVIVEGRAEITKEGEHVRALGPGEFFGETSMVDHERSRTTATAVTPLRLFVLPSQSFWSLVRRNPVVHCRVLDDLVKRTFSSAESRRRNGGDKSR